jgi:tetratricopeptide (TPR) repeat protein
VDEDEIGTEPSQLFSDPVSKSTVVKADAKADKSVSVGFPANLDEIDIDLPLAESAFADLGKPMPALGVVATASLPLSKNADLEQKPDFAHSVNSVLREINTQEMLDIRQQAEFFMALGQYDEAIGVLKTSINGSIDSNPLVYLDLIKVFHTLSQKTGFYQYRDQFNCLFTGQVPEYANFNQQGQFLDAYPQVCERIVALWPSDAALSYIEKCLVRDPGVDQTEGFDLEAYRELLMLHGVVKRIISESDSDLMPFSAMKLPTVTAQEPATAGIPLNTSVVSMSLDLDLSEPEPENNLIEFDSTSFVKSKVTTPPALL